MQGDLVNVHKYMKGECKVTGTRLFAVVSSDKMRASGHEVKGKRYCLHVQKCCFIVWVTEH